MTNLYVNVIMYTERNKERLTKMINFILGMGTMWIIISVTFFLLDCFKLDLWESDRAYLKWLFFPIYLIAILYDNWCAFVRAIKIIKEWF